MVGFVTTRDALGILGKIGGIQGCITLHHLAGARAIVLDPLDDVPGDFMQLVRRDTF
ncbi:MAG: hypothetical protein R3268_05850 [Acidiferrobacterales bacterium]|nr:hypothetical protein [Acidiferrobacterales bacterium]